jgi:hypothetical protein
MVDAAQLREGMAVFGAVDQFMGTIERLDSDGIVIGGRHVPREAIERVATDRVYLRPEAAQVVAGAGGESGAAAIGAPVHTPGRQRDESEPSLQVVEEPPGGNPQNAPLLGSLGTVGSSAMPSPTAREETPRDPDLKP